MLSMAENREPATKTTIDNWLDVPLWLVSTDLHPSADYQSSELIADVFSQSVIYKSGFITDFSWE